MRLAFILFLSSLGFAQGFGGKAGSGGKAGFGGGASAGAVTPTVVQKIAASCTTAISCSTSSITTHNTNSVWVACMEVGTTAATMSASDGTNIYNAVGSANTINATLNAEIRWFQATNITGVAQPITCAGTNDSWGMFVYEVAGGNTSTPVDVPGGAGTSGASGNSTTPSFTLPATTNAHDLLLFAAGCTNVCSADGAADAGNSQTDGFGNESETYAKSVTGTYTGQFSQTTGQWIVVGVAVSN